MLRMLILILAAALIWSVWWALGSTGAETATRAWFDARRADGWVAKYGQMKVQGFPGRLDTVFKELTLADPVSGLAWEAPRFQINALSYRPNHLIAVWPDEQLITTPQGRFRIESNDMRASLLVAPKPDLPLKRATLSAEAIGIVSADGAPQMASRTLVLAAEQRDDRPEAYRLGVDAADLVVPADWLALIDPDGDLPDKLSRLKADLTVSFDRVWDMRAIERDRPQPRRVDLRLAEAAWGGLQMQMTGTLTIDADGLPTGEITIKTRNWRGILDIGLRSGLIPPELATPLKEALGLMAQLKGDPKTLDIPLSFRDGRMQFGPVVIGPAPVLTIR